MSAEHINYDAVLADLQQRRDKIDAAIEAIKHILGAADVAANGISKIARPNDVPSDAFFTLSIPDAAKKYLGMARSTQSTEQIRQALEKGGLPPITYNSMYKALRRSESQAGDIVRMGDDWGLTEWYANAPNIKKRSKQIVNKGTDSSTSTLPDDELADDAKTKALSRPIRSRRPRGGGITLGDGAEKILREAGTPLHADEIMAKLESMGKSTTKRSLNSTILQDPRKRFKLLGGNVFDLADRSEVTEARLPL